MNYSYYGGYGRFHSNPPTGMDKSQYGPYSVNANFSDPNGGGLCSEASLQRVRDEKYGVQVVYNIKSAQYDYTEMFGRIARILFDEEGVTWTGNYYTRTSDIPTKITAANSYESYLGTWTMTTTNCLYPYWDENNTYRWFDWGPSVEKEITIAVNEEGKSFKVSGFGSYREDLCKEYYIIMDYDKLTGKASISTPQTMYTDEDGITWSWGHVYYSGGWKYLTSKSVLFSGINSNNSLTLSSSRSNAMIEPFGQKGTTYYGPWKDTSKGKQYATGKITMSKK